MSTIVCDLLQVPKGLIIRELRFIDDDMLILNLLVYEIERGTSVYFSFFNGALLIMVFWILTLFIVVFWNVRIIIVFILNNIFGNEFISFFCFWNNKSIEGNKILLLLIRWLVSAGSVWQR